MKNYMEKTKKYFENIGHCPVCGSINEKKLYKDIIHTCDVLRKAGIQIENVEVPSDIKVCKKCGHKYLSKVIKEEYLSRYYSVVGSEYYDSVKTDFRDRVETETKKFAKFVYRNASSQKNVLEIGSGMGHLLVELQKLGFICTGIEPSEMISNHSKELFKINVITGLLDFNTFPEKKFDIIILRDVIEHIYDVNILFKLVSHYLVEGGKVFILTGDSNSAYAKICGRRWLYFFSWEHVSFFNKNSISYLLTHNGFSMPFFQKQRHSGTILLNIKIFIITLRSKVATFLKLRSHKFFYMCFDHFVAIGQKKGSN